VNPYVAKSFLDLITFIRPEVSAYLQIALQRGGVKAAADLRVSEHTAGDADYFAIDLADQVAFSWADPYLAVLPP
jgi:hypothetical protein